MYTYLRLKFNSHILAKKIVYSVFFIILIFMKLNNYTKPLIVTVTVIFNACNMIRNDLWSWNQNNRVIPSILFTDHVVWLGSIVITTLSHHDGALTLHRKQKKFTFTPLAVKKKWTNGRYYSVIVCRSWSTIHEREWWVVEELICWTRWSDKIL